MPKRRKASRKKAKASGRYKAAVKHRHGGKTVTHRKGSKKH